MRALETSRQAWEHLLGGGGLRLETHDRPLVEEMARVLGLRFPSDLGAELAARQVPIEAFVRAFLEALDPLARMAADVCGFLARHRPAPGAEGLRILVDEGKGPEEAGLDVGALRRCLRVVHEAGREAGLYGWDPARLRDLARALSPAPPRPARPASARWAAAYDAGLLPAPDVPIPPTGRAEADAALRRAWRVWHGAVTSMRRQGFRREDLRRRAEAEPRAPRAPGAEPDAADLDLPDLRRLAPGELYALDLEGWPARMLACLDDAAARLAAGPADEARMVAAVEAALGAGTPAAPWERLAEVLGLPLWRRRHELRQAWVVARLDGALAAYPRSVHHEEGRLVLSVSGTRVATLRTAAGPAELWSTLRTPFASLAAPVRGEAVQPEHRIALQPADDPARTRLAVECRERPHAKAGPLADAIAEHVRAHPRGHLVLLRHAPLPAPVLQRLDPPTRARVRCLVGLAPGSAALRDLEETVRGALPPPIPAALERVPLQALDLIVVDVSGTMPKRLRHGEAREVLGALVAASPEARMVAVDAEVRRSWPRAADGLSEVGGLSSERGAALGKALAGQRLERWALVTGADGLHQVRILGLRPLLVVESDLEGKVRVHVE